MVSTSTVLRGIVVFLLAGLSFTVCALTLEQQFQQLKGDYVLTKELLEKSIFRLEKLQARLEVLELGVQQHTLMVEVFERRVRQLEASPAKLQKKMTEPLSKGQQQEDVANVPQIVTSSTTSKSVSNGIIDFIQEDKGSAEPTDAVSIILARKSVIRMDYNSVTLNKMPPSCMDPDRSKQCESEE